MSYHRAIHTLLFVVLIGAAVPLGADVAQPIPDLPRSGALPSASLPAAQVEDLVAPVALYPDALLSQVLVASTYPLEVVAAKQWRARNAGLEGAALMDEAKKQSWDASVQGLVAFPEVLDLMTEDVEWTSSLGDAFLAQEADVMAAVQRLRAKAKASGRLVSTAEQRVTEEEQEGRTVVQIVPATTEVVYVPRYDPWYVWGAPAWSAYPSLYYSPGYAFAVGVDVGFWFGGWNWGWGWGWYPNWRGGAVWVNGGWFDRCGYRYAHWDSHRGGYRGGYGPGHGGRWERGGRMAWSHDPGHRQGVPYSSGRNSSRYDAASRASRSISAQSGWRGDRGARSFSDGRPSSRGLRAGSDEGWRNRGTDSRRWGSAPSERSSVRGGAPEPWRDPGSTGRRPESAWRRSDSSRSPEQGWRRPSSPRPFESRGRDGDGSSRRYDAAPREFDASPRFRGSPPDGPSRGPSSEVYRPAPRGTADGGRGWSDGGGRRGSGDGGSRGSSGSFGSGGGTRGSGGGFSGGSRSGGGSQGGGHRGGGGRH